MKTMKEDVWKESVDFWNEAYSLREEDVRQRKEEADPEAWKELAPSVKQTEAIETLGGCRRLLDYGCGHGWASVIAAKSGCPCVTAVDVAPNSRLQAELTAELYGVKEQIAARTIAADFLQTEPEDSYDGFFSSNVLDVVPDEVADDILAGAYRVLEPGSPLVISLNYYTQPSDNPERHMEAREGKYLFVNGILRLACHTDEDWAERFSRFFTVEKLVHYAWPGEQTERRRLFYLRKK